MIAGGCRDDAPRALLGGEAREPVGRPADLERARALQVLEFEVDGHPEQVAERVRTLDRRVLDHALEHTAGDLELGERRALGEQAGGEDQQLVFLAGGEEQGRRPGLEITRIMHGGAGIATRQVCQTRGIGARR